VPEQQRTQEIPRGERQQVQPDAVLGHAEEPAEHERVREEDRVVEEGLGGHQRQHIQ
jgi:hypothetical protein